MFTGIITDIGRIEKIVKSDSGVSLFIKTQYDISKTSIGASIACSGVCLTVVEKNDNVFKVDVSGETLSCTNIGSWEKDTKINLEQALKVGDELGGHIVSGHVDGLAVIKQIKQVGDSYEITIIAPENLKKFIAAKGSVTLDGISLTVNDVADNEFTVNIIPHTWMNTNLSNKKNGDKLNIEIDMLARYVKRLLEV